MSEPYAVRRILGVDFYVGDLAGALERATRGGLLVVPAAPSFKYIATSPAYREAVVHADTAITDSAFMVMVWNLMAHDSIRRISGLRFLRALLERAEVRAPGNTLWVMASAESAARNLGWLREQGIAVPAECVYLAPRYGDPIDDPALVERIERLRVRHVVLTVGGGTQEPLGHYLKCRLSYLPSIYCIGAAIAFLSGDQVRIPEWADRLYLGWLFRCLSSPRQYVPRYLSAVRLARLLWRYRDRLPVEP